MNVDANTDYALMPIIGCEELHAAFTALLGPTGWTISQVLACGAVVIELSDVLADRLTACQGDDSSWLVVYDVHDVEDGQ